MALRRTGITDLGNWQYSRNSNSPALAAFEGETSPTSENQTLYLAPLNAHNAAALRSQLSWLHPRPLGLATSAGLGDRLGLATPGHVRAVRAVGGQIAPIFAQQSMRGDRPALGERRNW